MRAIRLAFLTFVVAGSLAAQEPVPRAPRTPAPMMQAVTLDGTALLLDEQWRVVLEPFVIGRFTIGLTGSYTTKPEQEPSYYYPYPMPLAETQVWEPPYPCYPGGPCPSYPSITYKAWSLGLSARWYPASLSIGGERQQVGVYIGEFISYHKRELNYWPVYYRGPDDPMPLDTVLPPDTTVYPYPDPYPYPYPTEPWWTETLKGWEPGLELGVRLTARPHIVFDVGGWVRFVSIQDPTSSTKPGDLDARFVLGVGIGW
jgi:hypothetical protein